MNEICFECESVGEIHQHHVIPLSLGGTKTVPLCVDCHGKIHNLDFRNHSVLTKKGLENAKKRGVKLGSPQNLSKDARNKGINSIKRNRSENQNWISAKKFMDDYILKNKKYTLTELSKKLNSEGYRTRKGCLFSPGIVRRLIILN
jgi:uncharacterized protein YegP (UPF0339 family)